MPLAKIAGMTIAQATISKSPFVPTASLYLFLTEDWNRQNLKEFSFSNFLSPEKL